MKEKIIKAGRLLVNEVSKSGFLRSVFPFMQDWYQSNVAGNPAKLQFLGGHPYRIVRNKMFWLHAPRKYAGGIILNVFGAQCLRYITHNILRPVPVEKNDYLRELRVNGVQKIDGILDSGGLNQLTQFYEKYKHLSLSYFEDFSELIIFPNTRENKNFEAEDFRNVHDLIFKTLNVETLYRDIAGSRLEVIPFVSILHYKSFVGERYMLQFDKQDVPHCDVFYPSHKLFVYLNDVDENNGAFMYFPGTHRYTPRNVIREYLASLRYYFIERAGIAPTNAFRFRKACAAISLVGRAGTGVLFNVAGIHRRGNFLKDKYRERMVLLVDFRQQEAMFPPKNQLLSSHPV
ncbi:hypothetical protein SCL_1220 [Sulfuricaulis limicola]|uniref:Phytanoyl-CoA dioxygenase n=1 Tax=Sulfuricaulis limicola TaxID=1620215 RepID=A0A1B4XFF1_9GAMM|nr:phytanoyl-CoA dioxygenase family protein [Sulfuricaulis limicola]BAV33533.1 hypothetical protein SCL_1220 [Sulfuricaulis limicola]